MSSEKTRVRRQRGSLSAEEILDGAFAVAATTGLDGLSMPGLAAHLGVGVTSLYWYFRKKDDLLRAMNDRAVHTLHESLPEPRGPEGWRAFLHDYFSRMRELYRSDDVLIDLSLVRIDSYSLHSTHYLYQKHEAIIEMLVRAGFGLKGAWTAFGTPYAFTRGMVIGERAQRLNNSPILDERQSRLIVPETMPRLAQLIEQENVMLAMVSADDFLAGLALILDGLERLRNAPAD
ncbi:TetR/AcrR family transcriptional regulator [Microbacterium sp. RD1]|uniref:TetR/AcrR family transcriptional regulator n=1 Tax=Microbacterium sp. RD1 TaxID=3457313 RepID=UPI003FA53136